MSQCQISTTAPGIGSQDSSTTWMPTRRGSPALPSVMSRRSSCWMVGNGPCVRSGRTRQVPSEAKSAAVKTVPAGVPVARSDAAGVDPVLPPAPPVVVVGPAEEPSSSPPQAAKATAPTAMVPPRTRNRRRLSGGEAYGDVVGRVMPMVYAPKLGGRGEDPGSSVGWLGAGCLARFTTRTGEPGVHVGVAEQADALG